MKQPQFLSKAKFEINFERVFLSESTYFVPAYAHQRPAVKMFLNGEFYEPKTHLMVRRIFELSKGSMVHAGTFFGDMLPSFSRSVSGTIYAFEPVLENYILATLCVEENNLSNVFLLNAAVSETNGILRINTHQSGHPHAGGASKISATGEICAALRIDALDIDDLVLIQLDVEGHEASALAGASRTIQKNRPIIALEDNNNDCAKILSDFGYDCVGKIPGLKIWCPKERDERNAVAIEAISWCRRYPNFK